jgi:hypothetical protein
MTGKEAVALVTEIAARYPGAIQVRIKLTGRGKKGPAYRLDLLLRPGQRRASVWTRAQWYALECTWSYFLPTPVENPSPINKEEPTNGDPPPEARTH